MQEATLNKTDNELDEDLSKSHLRLWLKVLRLCSGVKTVLRERLKTEFDTTLPRFDVMAALYQYDEGLRMSELSSVLRVSNGNVTGIIDRLEQEGFVARLPVATDRRATVVKLTAQGKTEFAAQAKAHEQWIHELFSDVTATRYHTLTQDMDAMLSGLSQLSKQTK